MARYAILENGTNIVKNITNWNGDTGVWNPPAGHTAVLDDTKPYAHVMPSPPDPTGLAVPSFGFEVATDKQSIDRLRDDYVHQTSKIARGVKSKNDATVILVADKFGVKHEVPFNDYITGLDYIGDVIRTMWEQGIEI